jgi:hypothetical protein
MIIYKNLGPEAQSSFSQTWGVSYALDNCTEWQDVRAPSACALRQLLTRALLRPQVAIEAGKVALVLVILDLLRITKDRPWFEARLLCCQASVPCVLTPHAAKRSTSTSYRSRPCSSTALAATGGSACPRIGYRGPPARADPPHPFSSAGKLVC